MSVSKRGDTYWYKFYFPGKLIRETAKTDSKTSPRTRRRTAGGSWRKATTASPPRTKHAGSRRSTKHQRSSSPPTSCGAVQRHTAFAEHCVRHLKRHAGDMMLIEIGDKTVLDYQSARLREKASGKTINEKVRVLLQVMGDLGDPIRLHLRRQRKLKVAQNPNCGKVLTAEQESALLEAAKVREPDEETGKFDLKDTRSPIIYTAVVTALNTGMRDFELRGLRWEQLDFLRKILTVGKSKTDAGTGRMIPMNGPLFEALVEHKKWC